MDNTRPSPARPLNYFQQSPVRGQLEPSDSVARSGWRYLQCTDTPNELRVLIPPRTALVYSHILKAERLELAKDKAASWDYIMQIRHLKDRIIRKCQRLARASTTKDRNTSRMMMFTLHAPPDFRCKEMERWYRDQGPEFARMMTGSTTTTTYCCSQCGPLGATSLKRSASTSTRTATATATSTRTPLPKAKTSAPSTRTASPARDPPKSRAASSMRPAPQRMRKSSMTSKAVQAPIRVPKRPSDSSSKTAAESSDDAPKYVVIKADLVKQEIPSATVSRSSSLRSIPSAEIPTVIRQPPSITPAATPPTASPQRSIEELRPPSRSSSRARSPLQSVIDAYPSRESIQSPDPLPIPYRPRDLSQPQESEDAASQVLTSSPQSMHCEELPPLETAELEEPRAPSPDGTLVSSTQNDSMPSPPAPTTGQPLATIHEGTEPGSEIEASGTRRPLIRRRSSLKKRDSMSKLSTASQSKSVTWAMDRDWTDQMSKFVKTTNEAEVAAYELGELRQQYHEEVQMMRILCHDAVIAAEQLGLNTDRLKREQQALAEQESKVYIITDHVEHREEFYREKVLAVLEETKRVISLCDKKRDQHDDI